MAKLLKVLVIVLLLLSIVSLTFATMLYGKRELLKGRNKKMEAAIIAFGAAIESDSPDLTAGADFPSRDASECSSEAIETPERSDFWATYKPGLETQAEPTPTLVLNTPEVKQKLMSFYKIDPITGTVETDAYGQKITEGEGTMHSVLQDVRARAEEQYNNLIETRQQLLTVRKELEDVITELNTRKTSLRSTLKENEEHLAKMALHAAEVRKLDDQIAELQDQKDALDRKAAQSVRDIEGLEEQLLEKDAAIAQIKKQLDMMSAGSLAPQPSSSSQGTTSDSSQGLDPTDGSLPPTIMVPIGPSPVQPTIASDSGVKGTVAAIDPVWDFVVLRLSDEFLEAVVPNLDLIIKRPSDSDKFVTKVRVSQIRKEENLAIADIVHSWEQRPVQEGDIVFY